MRISITLTLLLIAATLCYAQTEIEGEVSGVWAAEDSALGDVFREVGGWGKGVYTEGDVNQIEGEK